MPRTTQCPECGVVMAVPDAALGRRLKCPKCSAKFYAEGGPATPPSGSAPKIDAERASSTQIHAAARSGEVDLPVLAGARNETFELPLMDDSPARPATSARSAPGPSDAGDLFKEDAAPRRRRTTAELRSTARRCSCGSVVPAGMSLCSRCGLDLDTGKRHAVDEFIDEAPAPRRPDGVPIGILIVGVAALIASAILGVMAILMPDVPTIGKASLGLVCGFGLYAAVEFLRGKSHKLILVALLLGGAIDVVGLLVMPVVTANEADKISAGPESPAGTDDEATPNIKAIDELIDMNKIKWGIALLLADGAAFIYLTTNKGIRRHFAHG